MSAQRFDDFEESGVRIGVYAAPCNGCGTVLVFTDDPDCGDSLALDCPTCGYHTKKRGYFTQDAVLVGEVRVTRDEIERRVGMSNDRDKRCPKCGFTVEHAHMAYAHRGGFCPSCGTALVYPDHPGLSRR